MKFRKKPVVIEAVLNPPDAMAPKWFWLAINAGKINLFSDGHAEIDTLEGTHRADAGDWIIQGVKGELYPCKPDIFALTYEVVE